MTAQEPAGATKPSPQERAELSDLLAGYAVGLDVGDVDAVVTLFTEDGEFHTYGRVFSGHDGLRAMLEAAPQGGHLAGAWTAECTRDGFAVRQQLAFFPADRAPHRFAVYDDVVVRTSDGLRFRSRQCRFMDADGVLGPRP